MSIDVAVFRDYWPIFLRGFLLTVVISLIAPAVALVLGAVLALFRLSHSKAVSYLARALSEIVRDLPFMVILFLIFYFLPVLGIRLPALIVGILTLSIYGAAYFSEIIRGAVQSVPPGQMESARSTGMSRLQAFRYVIVPQMMGYFIPPATSQVVLVVKDSAVLSTITVGELTMSGMVVQGYTYAPIEVFAVISALYWILCSSFARLGTWLEARVDPAYRRRGLRHV
jgi:His/Glu/Gln/Arg/opine family amino acid ABC transporter permease subunit